MSFFLLEEGREGAVPFCVWEWVELGGMDERVGGRGGGHFFVREILLFEGPFFLCRRFHVLFGGLFLGTRTFFVRMNVHVCM